MAKMFLADSWISTVNLLISDPGLDENTLFIFPSNPNQVPRVNLLNSEQIELYIKIFYLADKHNKFRI